MLKVKLSSLMFILSLTMLAVSCSEHDQDVIPTQLEAEFDIENSNFSLDPIRESDRKKADPSVQLQFDSTKYAHHFMDSFKDYFYFNEIPSHMSGQRSFEGVWEIAGAVYKTTLVYDVTKKTTAMCAYYRSDMVFYYSLSSTTTPRYHTGAFAYLNCNNFPKKVRPMNIRWMKGGF